MEDKKQSEEFIHPLIEKALKENPAIFIGHIEKQYPLRENGMNHIMDYWIAPKKAIRGVKRLNNFLRRVNAPLTSMNILVDISPFKEEDGELYLGQLFFDKKHIGDNYTERSIVKVYPNQTFLEDIVAHKRWRNWWNGEKYSIHDNSIKIPFS